MTAAIFHLGRPFYAFRALLGLRTSWMSREILAFNLFAAAATGSCLLVAMRSYSLHLPPWLQNAASAATVVTGLVAVFCSAMIYVATRKPLWNFRRTTAMFYLSAAVLGTSTTLVVLLMSPRNMAKAEALAMGPLVIGLCATLMLSTLLKLAAEASVFAHASKLPRTAMSQSAELMRDRFRSVTASRFACGVLGGLLLPVILLLYSLADSTLVACMLAAVSLAVLLAGEVAERFLFFTSVAARKMPGAAVS
jgi:DMSO reductase anchor subunit